MKPAHALLLVAVMLLTVQQGTAKSLTYGWKLGGVFKADGTLLADPVTKPICLELGDTALLKWAAPGPLHNVWSTPNLTPTTICNKAAGKKLTPNSVAGEYKIDATKLGIGKYGYFCQVASHCAGGMKAVFEVKPKGGCK